MMKTSHTFYATDSRQVFIQRIAGEHVFMVDVFVVSISPLMTFTGVLFVLFYFKLFLAEIDPDFKNVLRTYPS